MKTSRATKALLAISGTIGIGIGGALLFAPIAFQASSGIILEDNVNLLNETRAPGGAIFASGILIVLGAFNPRMAPTSLLISSLIYLSYGVSRAFSMVVDGIPHDALVTATGLEIVIGLLSLSVLLKLRRNQSIGGNGISHSSC